MSAVAVHFTFRALEKLEIMNRPLHFTERTLKRKLKKQSGPAPSPPQASSTQPTSTPPGTKPLGAERREPTATKPEGLLSGMIAWRLKKTIRCTVTNSQGGRGRLSTLQIDGEVAAVMNLPSEAPLLPCRRFSHHQPQGWKPCSFSSPRRARRRGTSLWPPATDPHGTLDELM